MVLALIFDFTVTMNNKPSFLLLVIIIASSLRSSEGYGTKQFSHSSSSSSASAHASSFASSGSYTYSSGHNPKQLAFTDGVSKVNAVAAASATAGGTTAIANSAARAYADAGANSFSHNAAGNPIVYDTVENENQAGTGTYSVGASHSNARVTTNKNIGSVSYPDTHRSHNIWPASDGSYLAGDQYSATTASTKNGYGAYSYKQNHDQQVTPSISETQGQSGSRSYSVGSGKVHTQMNIGDSLSSHKHGVQQLLESGSQVEDNSNSPGGYSSSKASNTNVDSDQYSYNLDAPKKISTTIQSGSGSYSTGAGSSTHSTTGDGLYPYNQGIYNSVGIGSQVGGHSYSGVGHIPAQVANTNMGISSYSHNHGKHHQEFPNKIGSYSQPGSGSYSSGVSSSAATRNPYMILGDRITSNNQGRYDTIGSGTYVKDGLYSAGNDDSSNDYNGATNSQANIGYISTNNAAVSDSNNKYNRGSYDGDRNRNVEKEGSYSSGYNYGTAGSKGSRSDQSDYSFEKKYFQPVDHYTPTQYQPRLYPQEVIPKDKPFKNVFPGPDGSIYDYKVPSQKNNIHSAQSNTAKSESTGGSQSIASSRYNIHTKPCCKGPFPGPVGSIYESKPASAVGTAVKTSLTHPPLMRVTPRTPTASLPGLSGSIYTTKPVNIDKERQNGNKWLPSAFSGTYQKQFGSSPLPLSPCTKTSCTKEPKLTQQTNSISYLGHPKVEDKPIIESAEEEHKPNINTYILHNTPTINLPHEAEKSITNLSPINPKQQSASMFSGSESNIDSSSSGEIVQTGIKVPQKFDGSFSIAGASSYSVNSEYLLSTPGKVNLGDSKVNFGATPIDISTTIEKEVPKVYTNGNRDVIAEKVGISTTIEKQVPKSFTNGKQPDSKYQANGFRETISKPVAVSTTLEKQAPKVYTSTLYIDLKKPSTVIDSDSKIFEKPTTFSSDGLLKTKIHSLSSGSHGVEAHRGTVNSGTGFSSSGSNSYGSSGGFGSAYGCNIPGCGTSYRQYSNAVPSQGAKTSIIHSGTLPYSGYFVGTDESQNNAGSYGSQTTGNGYDTAGQDGSRDSSSRVSYEGTFPKKSISPDGSYGGSLSSSFVHGIPGHAAHAGSLAKAGSYSSSSSYSKANSFASASSFASSSSGSYSSHHH